MKKIVETQRHTHIRTHTQGKVDLFQGSEVGGDGEPKAKKEKDLI